jgi:hypothetical protein
MSYEWSLAELVEWLKRIMYPSNSKKQLVRLYTFRCAELFHPHARLDQIFLVDICPSTGFPVTNKPI